MKSIGNIGLCYYDEVGNVFLFDEISPRLVARYIIQNMHYKIKEEVIYAYVCRVQMKKINEFYKDIRSKRIVFCISANDSWSRKMDDKYYELVKKRLNHPMKRLRGI